jgi:secreted trypsin-like serine protease
MNLYICFVLSFFVFCADGQKCGTHSVKLAEPMNFRVVPNPLDKVVGGNEAVPHTWPWMAALAFQRNFICGGSLIDPQFVLTAAHCFAKSTNPALYKVILGAHDFSTGLVVGVKAILVHPLFNRLFPRANDVVLLKLDRTVQLNKNINTICLPTYYTPSGLNCVVTGWGRTFEGGPHADALQEVSVPIWDNGKCNLPKFYPGMIHANMMCAGYEEGGKDSCQGDSGGPLVCPGSNNQWQLHGIVSWGVGCAREGRPGVYSRVSMFTPWIISEMRKNRS